MKALDIYLAMCFFMVFGALLEYAMVGYTGKRIKLHQRRFHEFKKRVEELRGEVEKRRREGALIDLEEHCHSRHRHTANCPYKVPIILFFNNSIIPSLLKSAIIPS